MTAPTSAGLDEVSQLLCTAPVPHDVACRDRRSSRKGQYCVGLLKVGRGKGARTIRTCVGTARRAVLCRLRLHAAPALLPIELLPIDIQGRQAAALLRRCRREARPRHNGSTSRSHASVALPRLRWLMRVACRLSAWGWRTARVRRDNGMQCPVQAPQPRAVQTDGQSPPRLGSRITCDVSRAAAAPHPTPIPQCTPCCSSRPHLQWGAAGAARGRKAGN